MFKNSVFKQSESDRTKSLVGVRSVENNLFEETAYRAIKVANRRKWTLISAISLLVVTGVVLLVLNKLRNDRHEKLSNDYVVIESIYNAEVKKFQDDQQALGDKAPSVPDFSASAQKFAEFSKAQPSDPLGWNAGIRAAGSLLEQKKYEEAKTLLEPIVEKSLKNLLIQVKVRRTLAGIYAELKDYDKALKHLEFAEKISDNPILGQTRLFKAQVLFLADKKTEAAAILRELSLSPGSFGDLESKAVATEATQWLGFWNL